MEQDRREVWSTEVSIIQTSRRITSKFRCKEMDGDLSAFMRGKHLALPRTHGTGQCGRKHPTGSLCQCARVCMSLFDRIGPFSPEFDKVPDRQPSNHGFGSNGASKSSVYRMEIQFGEEFGRK